MKAIQIAWADPRGFRRP